MRKLVVIMKTHLWSDDIESFANKLHEETKKNKIDFFVIVCGKIEGVKNESLNVIQVSEEEIKSLYPFGFYSIWLSNHWILMWFFKKFSYDYYWSIEYDVRISGDSSIIWNTESDCHFLYVKGNVQNPRHKYNDYHRSKDLEKYVGFLQLARYSKESLEYLDKCYEKGENGQDELITYSLLRRGNFTMSNLPLSKLVRGTWTYRQKYSNYNKKIYMNLNKKQILAIFHPIK